MRFMNTRILPMMIVNCQFARKMLSVHVLSGFMKSTFRLYMVQYTHFRKHRQHNKDYGNNEQADYAFHAIFQANT